MEINKCSVVGCYEILPNVYRDERGVFVKTFHKQTFEVFGLDTTFDECFYSSSKKGVLRGMHFQTPPHEYAKLVYCVEGKVFDAVFDLRKTSATYGKYEIVELDSSKANMLYIPPGLAHGFYTLTERSIMVYKVSAMYSFEHDTGLLWNSLGIPWPDENPIMSDRDRQFLPFHQFHNPFD